MREIKFRVWSFNQKAWAEKQSSVIKFSCSLNEVFETSVYAFQQFTGLLDCQGKEIFEGDIVRDVHDGFLDVSFGRYLDGKGMAHSGFHLNDMFGVNEKPLDGTLLVVGNIFEHDVTNDYSIVKR